MALTSANVVSEGTTLERKILSDIRMGISEKLILLNLITDVSAQFNPGQKSYEWFQWENAANVADTPENGNEGVGGNVVTNSIVIADDQDKYNSTYVYDKAGYLDAADRAAGFYASAGFKHGRFIETFVATAMRTAAQDSITCKGTTRAGVVNASLDGATLEELAIAFDDQNLPKEGRRLIVTSAQKHELIRNFSLTDASKAASDQELRNAFLARLYGFDVYEANTNILPLGDANQAMAFVSDAAFWGMGIAPKAESERHASKFRTFYSLRSRFGAKVNTLPNSDGDAVDRVFLVGKGASS